MIKEMLFLEETESTNAYCKKHFNEMCDGDVVYTLNQTAGRGRLGRTWANSPGNALYFSEIVKCKLKNPESFPLAASLAVEDALERMYGIVAQIKWPNDLLLDGKKLAGILCEGVPGGYIFGVGINLCQKQSFFDEHELLYATSILAHTGESPRDFSALALAISESLSMVLSRFAVDGFAPLRGEYRARCVNLLHEVQCDEVKGIATDIDINGRLVVRAQSGELAVFTGEVHVQGIYGY